MLWSSLFYKLGNKGSVKKELNSIKPRKGTPFEEHIYLYGPKMLVPIGHQCGLSAQLSPVSNFPSVLGLSRNSDFGHLKKGGQSWKWLLHPCFSSILRGPTSKEAK